MEERIPAISVVVPVYNEAPNLRDLHARIVAVLEAYGRSFEIVAVDDGSGDSSLEVLEEIRAQDPRLRIIQLSRNFGQQPAMYAGFASVRGDIVVSIDADLQNPPEEMTKLIDKLDEGYDVVQGWRENRRDSVLRRGASKLLNILISRAIGVKIRDLGCGMKAYRRQMVDQMAQFTHHSRYVPAEIVWLGARMAEVKVRHDGRAQGDSKYGVFSLLRLAFNMVASVSTAPIKIIGMLGWIFALGGFAMSVRVAALRVIHGDWDSLVTVIAIFFLLAGVQLIATSLLCEYVSRIFIEVQRKPLFVVKKVIE